MSETTNLKERLASLQASKNAKNNKELKVRVASAWTLAKSLLPAAPVDVQMKMANALLSNSTQALTASLRQTAINSHYTKLAERFEQIHKIELNELIEDESLLNKLKAEVERELKGEAKNASAKTADELGEGIPPVENNMDAPGEEVPPAEGEEMPPVDDMPPAEGEAIPDAKKEELLEKIDNLEADVAALEETIEGEEELDFTKIFDQDTIEDKTQSLANEDEAIEGEELDGEFSMDELGLEGEQGEEGEEEQENLFVEADGGASFFSDTEALEGQLDGDTGTTDPSEFFTTASRHDVAAMDSLLAPVKVAKGDVVERGEMAQELLDESGVPDAEADHEDVILFEVLQTIKPEKFDPGTKRDTQPKLEKSASARTSSNIRSLGNVRTAASKDQQKLASLVFLDEV